MCTLCFHFSLFVITTHGTGVQGGSCCTDWKGHMIQSLSTMNCCIILHIFYFESPRHVNDVRAKCTCLPCKRAKPIKPKKAIRFAARLPRDFRAHHEVNQYINIKTRPSHLAGFPRYYRRSRENTHQNSREDDQHLRKHVYSILPISHTSPHIKIHLDIISTNGGP